MNCPHCGTENPGLAVTCEACGKPLYAAIHQSPAVPAPPRQPEAPMPMPQPQTMPPVAPPPGVHVPPPPGVMPPRAAMPPPPAQSGSYAQRPPYAQPYRATSQTNGLAIASLVLGFVGCVSFVPWIIGLILGIVALSQINASNGQQGGKGLAIAGIVINGVLTLGLIVFIASAILSD